MTKLDANDQVALKVISARSNELKAEYDNLELRAALAKSRLETVQLRMEYAVNDIKKRYGLIGDRWRFNLETGEIESVD